MNFELTDNLKDRFANDLSLIAKEEIDPSDVEQMGSTLYVFASELATLRIFAKYQTNGKIHNPKARVGFSKNTNTFYFALDM